MITLPTLILICGPVGAGKTTYAQSLCKEIGGVRFSIDPWMQNLYAKDMSSLDFEWMMERVNRCNKQIWETASQILLLDGIVVLDLGFTTYDQRRHFYDKAEEIKVISELHYLNAAKEVRKSRVVKRNMEKDPSVYSFEVTDQMFNFMEPRFEVPSSEELKNRRNINA